MSGFQGIEVVPVFSPASPQAQVIKDLFVVILAICGVIMLVVTAMLVYNLVRFRRKPNDAEPPQTTGNKHIEILWTVIPLLIVTWIFVLTARAMERSDPFPGNLKPDLTIIAHQWWWEARYPSGVITANEIHIPTGKRLLLLLDAADVIHDFWVPQLARKMDMIPGHPNQIWLEADKPGTYYGACAEFCGAQHAWMRIMVIAQPPDEFAAWEKQQLQPAPRMANSSAERGAKFFQQMTCANCHAIRGTPAQAQIGPDLSHLSMRQTLATGVLLNNTTNLARWLENPQSLKSGTLMPNLQLTPSQVTDLVNYLEPGQPQTAMLQGTK